MADFTKGPGATENQPADQKLINDHPEMLDPSVAGHAPGPAAAPQPAEAPASEPPAPLGEPIAPTPSPKAPQTEKSSPTPTGPARKGVAGGTGTRGQASDRAGRASAARRGRPKRR